jgi:hypothetical protein
VGKSLGGNLELFSARYISNATRSWRRLLAQIALAADPLARLNTGNSNAAKTAITAITTKSSIKVKAPEHPRVPGDRFKRDVQRRLIKQKQPQLT